MTKRLQILFIGFFLFAGVAQAAEPLPGEACSTSGVFVQTGGPEVADGGAMLVCESGVWKTVLNYKRSGKSLLQIGYDTGVCDANKTGRMRYSSTSPTKWEYCDSNSWEAFMQPLCQEDDQTECYLNPARSSSDAHFIAGNIKTGVNILGITGALTGDYGPTGGTSYAALKANIIAAGQNITCAILADGSAWCWGYGMDGQLGDGNSLSSTVRVQVDDTAVSGTAWTHIDAGFYHVCALRDDNTAWCWGYGADGQLGTNDLNDTITPDRVETTGVSGTGWTEITAGAYHSCGVRDDNTAWCWGYGGYGQLGNGANPNVQSTPVAVNQTSVTGTAWTKMTGGWRHTCGLRDNGSIWCWGWGYSGIIGNESSTNSNVPIVTIGTGVSGTAWTDIGASFDAHNCGIRDDGTAWCWGYGSWGRLGNGSTATSTVPVAVSTAGVSGSNWTQISVGNRHTCALRDDNTMWCWGLGSNGQLGNQSSLETQASPVAVNGAGVTGTNWTMVDAGGYHSCALRNNETMWCWGDPQYGQLGRPGIGTPVIIPD